jgi:hypothetical protein
MTKLTFLWSIFSTIMVTAASVVGPVLVVSMQTATGPTSLATNFKAESEV